MELVYNVYAIIDHFKKIRMPDRCVIQKINDKYDIFVDSPGEDNYHLYCELKKLNLMEEFTRYGRYLLQRHMHDDSKKSVNFLEMQFHRLSKITNILKCRCLIDGTLTYLSNTTKKMLGGKVGDNLLSYLSSQEQERVGKVLHSFSQTRPILQTTERVDSLTLCWISRAIFRKKEVVEIESVGWIFKSKLSEKGRNAHHNTHIDHHSFSEFSVYRDGA